jgi:hypothetical protein
MVSSPPSEPVGYRKHEEPRLIWAVADEVIEQVS